MSKKNVERGLVILDMINKYINPQSSAFIPQSLDMIPLIQGELHYFRQRARPIIFCNTKPMQTYLSHLGMPGDYDPIASMRPRANEINITKSRPNAFYGTHLLKTLTDLNIKSITIVGFMSHTSVLLTAASALDLGFWVVVPQTCVASNKEKDHNYALELIESWLNSEQMHV